MSSEPTPLHFTHLDQTGAARMVDVGAKPEQRRIARAEAVLHCLPSTVDALRNQSLPKGDVFAVARVAAVLAAKRTDELIPLCHSLPLSSVRVDFHLEESGVRIETEVITTARTGVEMEALMAASVAGLTIYDMCKAVDKQMVLDAVRVTAKIKE